MRKHLLLLAVIVSLCGITTAFGADFTVTPTDSIFRVLERQNGKIVTVQLANGSELTGRLKSVSTEIIHLEGLAGRDHYDAVVAVSRIDAVVVRVKGGAVEVQKP